MGHYKEFIIIIVTSFFLTPISTPIVLNRIQKAYVFKYKRIKKKT